MKLWWDVVELLYSFKRAVRYFEAKRHKKTNFTLITINSVLDNDKLLKTWIQH